MLIVASGLIASSAVVRNGREPKSQLSLLDNWADESSCIDCHQQAEHFQETGHAQTLRRAADAESLAWLAKLRDDSQVNQEGTQIVLPAEGSATADVIARNARPGQPPSEVTLDWCFGSGHHAATWVHTLPDSFGATDLMEFRWSYFNAEDNVATTPGQPRDPQSGFFSHLGLLFDGPKASRCFSCHSSALPAESGAIDEKQLIPGVTCQRCHGPQKDHVASGGELVSTDWRPQDQEDAVNRCAQCHRRASEMPVGDVSVNNKDIVRFQPVGLVQSKCYVNSQMTCISCHDPHLPISRQDSLGIWQCVQCHNPNEPAHVLCGAGQPDECLNCHMPKVKMESPLFFTDHWIRVRETEE